MLMNNVSYKINNSELIIYVTGRIDSSNSADFKAETDNIIKNTEHESLTLDLEKLEYISSAGLRVILHLRKEEPTTKLVNVSGEIYEILEMTGFTEMMTVKKAYRHLSVDGCNVIGKGAIGTVYRIDDDIIVKVYGEATALEDIHRERELAKRAFVLGIPTAIPFDVVKVGDNFGSVFELLKARSFAELIIENPADLQKYIDLSVELMKKINSTKVKENELPSIKNKALSAAEYLEKNLPADKADKFRKMADEIPDILNMVHGDLHIKNVMMQNGEAVLIDMDTLSHGHPIFELQALFNAYIGYGEIDKNNVLDFFGIRYETALELWNKILRQYLESDDEAYIEEVENKAKLLGYAFLYKEFSLSDENPEGDLKRQIDAYRNHVLTLIDKVDSFDFEFPAGIADGTAKGAF